MQLRDYLHHQPELLDNVQNHWDVFFDEGVSLSWVSITGPGRGAQIDGIDANEDSEELLTDYFGIQNDDLITHVNGIALSSEANLLTVLNSLSSSSGWSITVRRWNGSTWGTLNYYVTLPISAP